MISQAVVQCLGDIISSTELACKPSQRGESMHVYMCYQNGHSFSGDLPIVSRYNFSTTDIKLVEPTLILCADSARLDL